MDIEGNRSSSGAFHAGEPLSSRKLNNIGITADYGITKHSDGVQSIQGPFGTVYMDNMPFVGDRFEYDYPFKCSVQQTDDGLEVYVRPGTVNNRMPRISGVYLDATVTPALQITESGTWDIVIKSTKTTATFFPDTVIIEAKKRDTYADDDANGYLVVATINVTGTAPALTVTSFSQIVYASQVVVRTKPGTLTAVWTWTSR